MADKEAVMTQVKELDFSEEADLLRVLAHPVRLQIVYGLSEVGDCNVKNIWSCLGLSQSNVSQHLNIMKRQGIIASRREGVEVHYFLTHPLVRDLILSILKYKEKEASPSPSGEGKSGGPQSVPNGPFRE
jgi:ArsR family transcriptional regulator